MTFLDVVFFLGYLGNYILTASAWDGYTYVYNRLVIALEGLAQ